MHRDKLRSRSSNGSVKGCANVHAFKTNKNKRTNNKTRGHDCRRRGALSALGGFQEVLWVVFKTLIRSHSGLSIRRIPNQNRVHTRRNHGM